MKTLHQAFIEGTMLRDYTTKRYLKAEGTFCSVVQKELVKPKATRRLKDVVEKQYEAPWQLTQSALDVMETALRYEGRSSAAFAAALMKLDIIKPNLYGYTVRFWTSYVLEEPSDSVFPVQGSLLVENIARPGKGGPVLYQRGVTGEPLLLAVDTGSWYVYASSNKPTFKEEPGGFPVRPLGPIAVGQDRMLSRYEIDKVVGGTIHDEILFVFYQRIEAALLDDEDESESEGRTGKQHPLRYGPNHRYLLVPDGGHAIIPIAAERKRYKRIRRMRRWE